MKKFLSLICCTICVHSFSQVPFERNSFTSSNEKVLMRAIATMMNREATTKVPVKKIVVYHSEQL